MYKIKIIFLNPESFMASFAMKACYWSMYTKSFMQNPPKSFSVILTNWTFSDIYQNFWSEKLNLGLNYSLFLIWFDDKATLETTF